MRGHRLGLMVLFVLLGLVSSISLLTAATLWLSQLVGSLIVALLLLFSISAIASLVIYMGSIRPAVKGLRAEISVIYEVAEMVRRLYRYALKILGLK